MDILFSVQNFNRLHIQKKPLKNAELYWVNVSERLEWHASRSKEYKNTESDMTGLKCI